MMPDRQTKKKEVYRTSERRDMKKEGRRGKERERDRERKGERERDIKRGR